MKKNKSNVSKKKHCRTADVPAGATTDVHGHVSSPDKLTIYIVALLLIVVTVGIYWQVRTHEFVDFDDMDYVVNNRHVQLGLTIDGVRWAFVSMHAANWHPVTWISHMIDRQVFGVSASGPHLINVIFHVANSVLLWYLLYQMTSSLWQSAFVAFLFALHPLHVESVAWVSERKDVLSMFFFLLTLLAYNGYAKQAGVKRYLLALLCYAIGLMSKPMLVTLPMVLLLLDYWPLNRMNGTVALSAGKLSHSKQLKDMLVEKIPFLLLAAASSVVTLRAQSVTIASFERLPLIVRTCNAAISYAGYLRKMIWPVDLAAIYPLTLEINVMKTILSALFLSAISIAVLRARARRPYLLVGWLWYLLTLVPVIGLVQVGAQSMADRYTYIPLIGIFIMISWLLAGLSAHWPALRKAVVVSCITALLLLSALTWKQVGYWEDTNKLFSHCIDVAPDNNFALGALGTYLVKQDKPSEALALLRRSLALNDKDADVQHGVGFALLKLGKDKEAIEHIETSIRLNPASARSHNDLAVLLQRTGDIKGALMHRLEAVRLEPDNREFRFELGVALVDAGELEEGIRQYSAVLKEDPSDFKALNNMGVALARQGRMNDAIGFFSRALELDPDDEEARENLELARQKTNSQK